MAWRNLSRYCMDTCRQSSGMLISAIPPAFTVCWYLNPCSSAEFTLFWDQGPCSSADITVFRNVNPCSSVENKYSFWRTVLLPSSDYTYSLKSRYLHSCHFLEDSNWMVMNRQLVWNGVVRRIFQYNLKYCDGVFLRDCRKP